MRETVRGYALGIRDLAKADESLASCRQEIEAVRSVMEREEMLLHLIDDAGVSARIKADVINDLFADKVSQYTLAMLRFLATEETPGEALESFECLSPLLESSYLLEEPGGFAGRSRIRGYARAIIEFLDRGELALLLDELTAAVRALQENPELDRFLSGFGAGPTARTGAVDDLFSGKLARWSLAILKVSSSVSGIRSVREVLEAVAFDISYRLQITLVKVTVARELTDSERERIAASLENIAQMPVEVEWIVDSDLVGGLVAIVGDRVYDASVRSQLARAKTALLRL